MELLPTQLKLVHTFTVIHVARSYMWNKPRLNIIKKKKKIEKIIRRITIKKLPSGNSVFTYRRLAPFSGAFRSNASLVFLKIIPIFDYVFIFLLFIFLILRFIVYSRLIYFPFQFCYSSKIIFNFCNYLKCTQVFLLFFITICFFYSLWEFFWFINLFRILLLIELTAVIKS